MSAYAGDEANVTIPEKIDGYTITAVGANAFKNNTSIEGIDLPDTVEVIEDSAFAGCIKLRSMKQATNPRRISHFGGVPGFRVSRLPQLPSLLNQSQRRKRSMNKHIFRVLPALLIMILLTSLSLAADNPDSCAANGHTMLTANYQAPATCSVCGYTEGEPLTPAFVEHGLDKNLINLSDVQSAQTFTYVTCGWSGDALLRNKKAIFSVTVSPAYFVPEDWKGTDEAYLTEHAFYIPDGQTPVNYSRAQDDAELRKTMLETLAHIEELTPEGYEWRGIHLKLTTVEWDDGYSIEGCRENYYDITGWDNSYEAIFDNRIGLYQINYNGDKMEVYITGASFNVDINDGEDLIHYTFSFMRVPVGYDGCIEGLFNARNLNNKYKNWAKGKYIFDYADEESLFFRLK